MAKEMGTTGYRNGNIKGFPMLAASGFIKKKGIPWQPTSEAEASFLWKAATGNSFGGKNKAEIQKQPIRKACISDILRINWWK